MKKIILFFGALLLLGSNLSFAQNVSWGETIETKNYYYPKIIGEDSSSIYISSLKYLLFDKREYRIERLSKNDFSVLYSVPFEFDKGDDFLYDYNCDGEAFLFNKYYFFRFKKDKGKEGILLIPYRFSEDDKKFILLDSKSLFLKNFKPKNYDDNGELEDFLLKETPDKSKLLIYYNSYDKKSKMHTHYFALLNSDLEVIAQKEEVLDKKSSDIEYSNVVCDNNGSIYCRKIVSETEQYIVSFDANNNFKRTENRIDLSKYKEKATITSINFNINSENDLTIVGFYTFRDFNEGCFFMKVDGHTQEIIVNKVNEFSKEFKEKFVKTKYWYFGENEKGLKDIFKKLMVTNIDNGGQIIIAEVYTHVVYHKNNTSGENFYSGDALVLNLSAEGDLIWSKKIPKIQKWGASFTEPIGGEKFFYLMSLTDKNNLYVIYNDDVKNLNIKEHEIANSISNYRNSVPVMCTYDLQTGEYIKKIFEELKGENIYINPSIFYQKKQGDDAFIMMKSQHQIKIGKIKF